MSVRQKEKKKKKKKKKKRNRKKKKKRGIERKNQKFRFHFLIFFILSPFLPSFLPAFFLSFFRSFFFYSKKKKKISGQAAVEWMDDGDMPMDGTRRLVRVQVERVVQLGAGSLALAQAEPLDDYMSPFNPMLAGPGAPTAAAGGDEALQVRLAGHEVVDADTVTFWFEVPEAAADTPLGRKLLAYQPGAYATFDLGPAMGHADPVVRTWTLSSAPACLQEPAGRHFAITVKRQPGGLATGWLHDVLAAQAPGAIVTVLSVGGGAGMSAFMTWPRITASPPPADQLELVLKNVVYSRIVMIAGGIGITPMLSSLRALRQLHALARRHYPGLAVALPATTLVYAVRGAPPAALRAELAELQAEGVLAAVVYAVTGGPPELQDLPPASLHRGRVDAALLDRALPANRVVSVFLCGPTTFMASLRAVLVDQLQLPPNFLHEESFAF